MTKKLFALLVAVCVMLSGMAVAFAEEVGSPTDVPTEPTITYCLTFEANKEGAYGIMDPIQLDAAGEVTIPALGFAHDMFDFTGWSLSIDGAGKIYAEGDKIAVDGEVKLYAQWIRKDASMDDFFTVTYDGNGGEGETIDDLGPYMAGFSAIVAENGFTYEDHKFLEWNTEADGSGTSYQPWDSIDEISADVVLYAIWEFTGVVEDPQDEQLGGAGEQPEGEDSEEMQDGEDMEDDDTVSDTDVPPMGEVSSFAVAAGICAVAAAAFVLTKKHN